MAHYTTRSGYESLVERLNRFPQGAPPSDALYGILKLLFNEKEASLVALLPIKPFTVKQAAAVWKMTEVATRGVLEGLASRCILLDAVDLSGTTLYALPPPMAGFFEFSMMRLRGDIDQHLLGELFYQYLNVEDAFVTALFTTENRIGRVFVNEDALPVDPTLTILDYERASEVARTASSRSVGMCYCRHKMSHVGRACDAPMDICLTFNGVSDSLARHGYARKIDGPEALDKLRINPAEAATAPGHGKNDSPPSSMPPRTSAIGRNALATTRRRRRTVKATGDWTTSPKRSPGHGARDWSPRVTRCSGRSRSACRSGSSGMTMPRR